MTSRLAAAGTAAYVTDMTIDITISDAAYEQLCTVLDAWRAQLEPLRGPLHKVLNSPQRQMAIDFAKSDAGRLLRKTHQFKRWLDAFFEDIGWMEGD